MLLEYGLKNFFGFKEGTVVSFRIPPKLEHNEGISRLICVKGKNASGKTNLLKALTFLSSFCTRSFQTYEPGDYIGVEPFFKNEEPTEFYIEFIHNGCEYRYELELTEEAVVRETLFRKNARKVKIVERYNNSFHYTTSEFKGLNSIKLRSNASFISSFKQYDLNEMKSLQDVYDFFNRIVFNVGYSGLVDRLPDTNRVSELIYNNSPMFEFIKMIIVSCDTGIKDIHIRKEKDEETGKPRFTPLFIHEVDGEEHHLPIFAESSGTKSLFNQLGRYQVVLGLGGILCLDEFDINLHPHILPKLIGLFESKDSNPNDAQLLFTTHNSDIMELLGKYRTYLVEKENNECFAYRLDEIPGDLVRNDRPISPLYNSGKLGGVPNL